MSTQPTVREMQNVIVTIRSFAEQDDYHLCRPYLKRMVNACADVLETVLEARDWTPVIGDNDD